MTGFVLSRLVGSPAVDDEGYPVNGFDEVVPVLAQADTTFTPQQLFDQGFDAVFDVCGWNRDEGMAERPYTFYVCRQARTPPRSPTTCGAHVPARWRIL